MFMGTRALIPALLCMVVCVSCRPNSSKEAKVKKESAKTEPAWEGAGEEVGLQIWRIVKFKVTKLSPLDYGKFFNGDSYIILNTYNNSDSEALAFDVHFWIGKDSTQDEYGTAAYKTVELDTYLDDKPVQHREVQGNESKLFKSYFPKGLTIMKGGAESGFREPAGGQEENEDEDEKDEENVKKDADVEKKTLFKVSDASGELKIGQIKDEDITMDALDSNDIFVLDCIKECFVWFGKDASPLETKNGLEYASTHLGTTSHPFAPITVLKEGQNQPSFVDCLTA